MELGNRQSSADRKNNPMENQKYCYDYSKSENDVVYNPHSYGYVSETIEVAAISQRNLYQYAIFSDTGTGKNTFFEECLIPAAMNCNQNILLFTNRVALGRQTKRRLAERFGIDLRKYTNYGLDQMFEFKSVVIMSYQQLEYYLMKNITPAKLNDNFGWVICDEVHYFLSDASFNGCTDMALNYILRNFKGAVKLFMTATPDEIFPVLKMRQIQANKTSWNPIGYSPKRWCIHEFEHDFSYLDVFGFVDREDIIDLIRKSDEKYLVFIENKKIGKEFIDNIEKGEMITADSKEEGKQGADIYEQIVEKERFDCRVLVTTSVLENGVNIKDPDLKNIVIFCNDKVKFLQMIGRIRHIEGQRIRLFIADINKEEVERKCAGLEETKRSFEEYRRDPVAFGRRHIGNRNDYSGVLQAAVLMDNGHLYLNDLAYLKCQYYDLPRWEGWKEAFINGESYPVLKDKFSWVGREFSEDAVIDQGHRKKLIDEFEEYLSSMKNKPMAKEDQEFFKSKFRELHDQAFGVREKSRRKGAKPYGPDIIKKILEEKELPYELETTGKTLNGTWILKEKS